MSSAALEKRPAQQVGRYTICDQLAAGGMATVHWARLVGSAGFSRVVAAKRMHRHFLSDPEFKRMFLAEAQLAARIQHPNVVPILDVLSLDDELIIFMDYVHGEALHALMHAALDQGEPIPLQVGCAVVAAVLHGLHAAHEARSEAGDPLGIVHRDVSPQNILVGADGVARVLDFGIAKALREQNQTHSGTVKGKFSYMAPEVINGAAITRQTDVFSAGVILWELLTGRKLFGGTSEQERILGIISGSYPSPRQYNPRVSEALERVVAKALQLEAKSRYASALQFAIAIEVATPLASQHVVGEWVQHIAATTLDGRMARIHQIETLESTTPTRFSIPPTQSMAVAASKSRQSIVTAVSNPTAMRRSNRYRKMMALLAVALTAVGGLWLSVRKLNAGPEINSTAGSTRLPAGFTLPIVVPLSSAAMTVIPNVPIPTAIVSTPTREATPSIVESPTPRKHSSPRAPNPPVTRAKSPPHAQKYLPSEL